MLTMGVAVSAIQDTRTEAEGQAQGEEETCGQEIARDAEVPESLGRLMAHVATNMDAHARWVGGSPGGGAERAALERVAAAYHAIAEASLRAAGAMRAMKDLPAVPHDPEQWERAGQVQWMRQKIAMQTAFANMILQHARDSEGALEAMQRPPK
ncbi:MAG TPA: hypothetical protein VGP64_11795 [Polyangia bacterium]